jgi:hypothetical protein
MEELKASRIESLIGTPAVDQAAHKGMLSGLDVLLRAMAHVRNSPKKLVFPASTLGNAGFGIFTSQQIMRNVCKEMEEWGVRQIKNMSLSLPEAVVHPVTESHLPIIEHKT